MKLFYLHKFYLVAFFLVLLIPSCKDKDEHNSLDYSVQRNNIIGEWNMRRLTQEIRADTVYNQFAPTIDVCFSFNANGKGFRKFSNLKINFEWFYQYDPPRVIIADDETPIYSLRNTTIYKVNINEKDQQVWEYQVLDSTGVADFFKHTLSFTKK